MSNTNYGQNGFLVQGASTTQTGFNLVGGRYAVLFIGTGTGSAGLSVLGPDGSSYIAITAATFSATNGFAVVDLPSGLYQVTISTFTNVNFSVTPISYHR
jgi:hypothetical protein